MTDQKPEFHKLAYIYRRSAGKRDIQTLYLTSFQNEAGKLTHRIACTGAVVKPEWVNNMIEQNYIKKVKGDFEINKDDSLWILRDGQVCLERMPELDPDNAENNSAQYIVVEKNIFK